MAKQLSDLDVYSFISGYATANSNSVSSIVMNEIQEVVYSTPGSYLWRAPIGVTNISVICIGGGGGGRWGAGATGTIGGSGGGALAWLSNFTVIPNNLYTVVVGQAGTNDTSVTGTTVRTGVGATPGGDSYFNDVDTCFAGGGKLGTNNSGGSGGTYTVSNITGTSGGGNGGSGGSGLSNFYGGGGGGAGGYSAAGGNGGNGNGSAGLASNGGGGGGGGGANQTGGGGGGGGVGIYGAGANGAGGNTSGTVTAGGGGGSNGSDGTSGTTTASIVATSAGNGGLYGGGAGGVVWNNSTPPETKGTGSAGVVRIFWGSGRAFPSTNTGYLPLQSTTYTYPSSIPEGYSVYTTRQLQGDNKLSTSTTISINTTTNPPTGTLSSNANFTGYFEILIAKTKSIIPSRMDQDFEKVARSGITNTTIGWN